MSLKQWRQELDKGLSSPVYLLSAADPFLLYEALTGLKARFGAEGDFNFEVLDVTSPDGKPEIDRIVDILNTLPFLTARKVVCIRNIQKWVKAEAVTFSAYLKSPSPTTLAVLLCEGKPPDALDTDNAKGLKEIPLAVSERELPQWIKARAEARGAAFTDRAVDCLISLAGTDLGMLHAEIEKFSAREGGAVDAEEVRAVVYAGAEYSAFDLTDALARKDARETFRTYEQVSRSTDPVMLLGALNWQLTGRGRPAAKGKAAEIAKLLHEADRGLKTSRSHVMEELLVRLLRL